VSKEFVYHNFATDSSTIAKRKGYVFICDNGNDCIKEQDVFIFYQIMSKLKDIEL
jgi:hypothetical protein